MNPKVAKMLNLTDHMTETQANAHRQYWLHRDEFIKELDRLIAEHNQKSRQNTGP